MVVIIYSAETDESITANLGRPEYSYYFVSKAYRAVLRQFACVVETSDPENEVDAIYEKCRALGEPCVFLSFSPPQRTVTGLRCPTIAVFAWEFATIPTVPFAAEPRNDWRTVFRRHGCAITHSRFAVRAVQQAMGGDFPVWCIPAPVWDDYAKLYRPDETAARSRGVDLTFAGNLIDFNGCDAASVPEADRAGFIADRSLPKHEEPVTVHLDGVIYFSLFSAMDGRKNWQDLVSAFVGACREAEDATLVLKVIHRDFARVRELVTNEIFKLVPFKCRIVILHGYLNDTEYANLVREATYVVNASHGEGQCLPLMEYMSAGTPAISPAHTAMEDYIHQQNAFVVRSSTETAFWPQDPTEAYRTRRYRISWESLCEAYRDSYMVAKNDPARYARMARSAVESLQGFCSIAVVRDRLERALRECAMVDAERRTVRQKLRRVAARAALRFRAMIVWLFGNT